MSSLASLASDLLLGRSSWLVCVILYVPVTLKGQPYSVNRSLLQGFCTRCYGQWEFAGVSFLELRMISSHKVSPWPTWIAHPALHNDFRGSVSNAVALCSPVLLMGRLSRSSSKPAETSVFLSYKLATQMLSDSCLLFDVLQRESLQEKTSYSTRGPPLVCCVCCSPLDFGSSRHLLEGVQWFTDYAHQLSSFPAGLMTSIS